LEPLREGFLKFGGEPHGKRKKKKPGGSGPHVGQARHKENPIWGLNKKVGFPKTKTGLGLC